MLLIHYHILIAEVESDRGHNVCLTHSMLCFSQTYSNYFYFTNRQSKSEEMTSLFSKYFSHRSFPLTSGINALNSLLEISQITKQ